MSGASCPLSRQSLRGIYDSRRTRNAYIRYLEDGIMPQRVRAYHFINRNVGAHNVGPHDHRNGRGFEAHNDKLDPQRTYTVNEISNPPIPTDEVGSSSNSNAASGVHGQVAGAFAMGCLIGALANIQPRGSEPFGDGVASIVRHINIVFRVIFYFFYLFF